MIRWFDIGRYERGFLYRGKNFVRVLKPGRHYFFDPLFAIRVTFEDVSQPMIDTLGLDVVIDSGALAEEAVVVDVKDGERALVWVEGRLEKVLAPGLHAFWTVMKEVRIEILDTSGARLAHAALAKILALPGTGSMLELVDVEPASVGLFFLDGVYRETLSSGRYAFWKGEGRVEVRRVDLREQVLDVSGQEIMTADKVTLRLNAVLSYSVTDARKAIEASSDFAQVLYREAQLAIRAVVGTRTLDRFLEDKESVVQELEALVRPRLSGFGIALGSFGIRDVILPGEMKDILNKVTQARKAAEANVITRREETAAMRSQLNTARLLESSPVLMRLRELEVLEKISEKARLNVILGSEGLAEKVTKLL